MQKAIIALAIMTLAAATAVAGGVAFGPRVGYTSSGSLDQVHLGGHAEVGRLGTNLVIVPSLEVDDFTELAVGPWGLYAGGGPVVTRYDGNGADSTDFALSAVVGGTYDIRSDRHLFGEIRLGIEDAPDLKLTLGLTFR